MTEVLSSWMDFYAIQQTDKINEWPKFRVGTASAVSDIGIFGTGLVGIDKGKFVIPTTSRPHFGSNFSRNRMAKETRNSARDEVDFYLQMSPNQSITFDMLVNSYNLSLFLWLLMQNGASEAVSGSNEIASFNQYTSSDPEIYCAMVRVNRPIDINRRNDYSSPTAIGCICRSITINGIENGLLTMSVELIPSFLTYYNNIGILKKNSNNRLNRYPIESGSNVKVSFINRQALPTTELSSVEKATDGDFSDSSSMGTNDIEWSLATGSFNFSDDLKTTYGTKGQEAIVTIDLGSGSYDDKVWGYLGGFGNKDWIKFEDLTFKTNLTEGSTSIGNYLELDCTRFTLTITNNVIPYIGPNQRVNKFVLGSLDVVGSFTISVSGQPYWQSGSEPYGGEILSTIWDQAKNFKIFTGASEASENDGDISFVFPYVVTNTTRVVEGQELADTFELEAVNSTSHDDLEFRCVYLASDLIRGIS